jgi:hypothetical protein
MTRHLNKLCRKISAFGRHLDAGVTRNRPLMISHQWATGKTEST